jgi:hypothetical protein
MPPNNEAQGTASVADLIGFPCINQYGEIYDTWKVSRESKSHSTPAGGVPRYALPFLAKVVDRSDKSLGVCSVVLRHIPRYYLMIRSTAHHNRPYHPAASLFSFPLNENSLTAPGRIGSNFAHRGFLKNRRAGRWC